MNTDQAFLLLKNAGVAEDVCIQTVRRWLREKKITYEANGQRKSGDLLEDTDLAFNLLKEAGISSRSGIEIVQRWLRAGRAQSDGNGRRKPEYISKETTSNTPSEQEKTIRQLKAQIKVLDEHIKGIEDLHKNSTKTFIQKRDQLKKEIVRLEKENSELQSETSKLLKENIELRNQLLKLKEELAKGNKGDTDKTQSVPLPVTNDYRRKLGLSTKAGYKEVLAGYKKLLKLTHPDQGGNAGVFHYIKTDYDLFRQSIKGS